MASYNTSNIKNGLKVLINNDPYEIIDNSLLNNSIDEIIIGIPCNTFHSEPILEPFLFYLNNIPKNNFKFLNMIELTTNYIKNNHENQKIGLLSTYGTISSNVYLNEAIIMLDSVRFDYEQ